MNRLSILCIVFTMAVYLDSAAQIPLVPYDSVVVSQHGIPISNPWAGGLNSPQFSEIDLNNDGFKDLVAFERNFFGSVKTFINQGISGQSGYVHAPEYQTLFPKMSNWMLLRDYNCDGREDIFTSVPGGIAVYRNDEAPDGSIRFTRISNLLQTIDLSGNTVPLYVPVSDIPAITDIDEDGALDILSFNLIGNAVEYHRNKSIDLNGHCDELLFEIESACWGYFSEANNNNTLTLFDTCSGNIADGIGRQRHPGSTLLALDLYGNGLKDLLLSDINFNQVVRLTNGGSAIEASMIEQFTGFPENTNPVDITLFPAAYHLDVDNDGLKDLLFAPNNPNTSENHNNVWFYKNEGTTSLPEFIFQQRNFLQVDMIDLGERSFPAFVDTDGDGLLDIVAGSYGYFESAGSYSSRLMLLQNTGTADNPAFEIVSDDYAGLSVYSFQGVYPCFGDIEGDGDMDMLVGDEEGRLHLFTNQAGPNGPADFVLTHPNYMDIDVGQSAKPQLVDVNNNGLPDLLIGERSGTIRYFENTGTVANAVFTQQATHANFGNINVLPDGFTGFSAPFFTSDSIGNPMLYVGSEQGYLYLYNNIENNLGGSFNLVDSLYLHGVNITPNGADINNNGKMELVYGQFTGGISLLTSGSPFFYHLDESAATVGKLQLYPNPASEILTVEVPESLQKGVVSLKITNISGILLYEQTHTGQNQSLSIDLDSFVPGIYFIYLEGEVNVYIQKFMKR
jgi:hypothetical protein